MKSLSPVPLVATASVYLVGLSFGESPEFPKPYNSEPDKNAAPPPAAEAVKSFELPPGFKATVFAAEPDVRNPIAMAWDHRGRMWVAENYTYAERGKRFELALRDRVLIFDDKDGDGQADVRKIFTDDVQMLTSIEVGRDGIWLMCPPRLLFVPDRDADDVPDGKPEVMLDGFTVAKGNYHNFANGLRWGPDGWLYGRCGHSCPGKLGVPGTPEAERAPIDGGIWRFHPTRKVVEVLTHGTTNPWGHDWDEHGQGFFVNTVNGHLWHLIPGAHFLESSGRSPNPLIFDRLDMHADHWHYDKSGSWTKSRGGNANEFGGGHSHIGMTIYQADLLPESWHGRLLTWNQHGRRANKERLERHGSGYLGRHEPDVFLAGDTWFRGLDIRTGPDGALYGLDWSDTGECHEHTGVHRESGRIYRFSHGDPKKPDLSLLADLNAKSIPHILENPNVWFERRARTLLAGSKPTGELVATLTKLLRAQNKSVVRLRALWMLNAIGAAEKALLVSLLDDRDEHLRVWAIRLLTDSWPIDSLMGPMDHAKHESEGDLVQKFVEMANHDRSGLVRLTLASTLQRLPIPSRPALGIALARRSEDADDHNLPSMVWNGISPLSKSDPTSIVTIARSTSWEDLLRWIARSLAGNIESDPKPVAALLEIAVSDPAKAPGVLTGMGEAFKGRKKAPRPANWSRVAAALRDSEDTAVLVRNLGALFGDGRAMGELKALVFDKKAELLARETALQALVDNRAPDLRNICEKLLTTRHLNITAVRGLATFDDPAIGDLLLAHYSKSFRPEDRRPVVDVLVSRPRWAAALLDRIGSDAIPRGDLSPFHARQILGHGDKPLRKRLGEVWGKVRRSDSAKVKRVKELKAKFPADILAKADLGRGRVLYQNLCASCHQLYGEGGVLGPDLTGSGRSDLDYLLENIVDPSAVVGIDYTVTILTLKDGRVLNGVIAAEDDRTLTVRLPNEEKTIEKTEVGKREKAPVSIMPVGLLDALDPDQIRDFLAYLMHPRQVPLPKFKSELR